MTSGTTAAYRPTGENIRSLFNGMLVLKARARNVVGGKSQVFPAQVREEQECQQFRQKDRSAPDCFRLPPCWEDSRKCADQLDRKRDLSSSTQSVESLSAPATPLERL